MEYGVKDGHTHTVPAFIPNRMKLASPVCVPSLKAASCILGQLPLFGVFKIVKCLNYCGVGTR
jgi:hypothetical protein